MDEEDFLDEENLGHFVRALARQVSAGDESPPTEQLFIGEEAGVRKGALLVKRTYKPEGSRWAPAPDADQTPVNLFDVPYAEVSPPAVSPLIAADESFAFKRMTDVIVQASAYTYAPRTLKTTAGLRFGAIEREIVVYGDRIGEYDAMGRPRFSEPQPFDSMPIRWDHAYGGFDVWAYRRRGIPALDNIKAKPEWGVGGSTPYHYPRNPAGCGFLIDLDEQSFSGLVIPNLEHPFAPLSPARMAVGDPLAWMRGPMPAAWDFQPLDWFPRCAYLGMAPGYKDGIEPAEVAHGWAARDLLSIGSFLHVRSRDEYRPESTQAAAPGMTVSGVTPSERFVLTNMHPRKPTHTIELPGEAPRVLVELSPGRATEAEVHLVSVVLRVDIEEIELLWSARFPLPPEVGEDELLAARRAVTWQRAQSKG